MKSGSAGLLHQGGHLEAKTAETAWRPNLRCLARLRRSCFLLRGVALFDQLLFGSDPIVDFVSALSASGFVEFHKLFSRIRSSAGCARFVVDMILFPPLKNKTRTAGTAISLNMLALNQPSRSEQTGCRQSRSPYPHWEDPIRDKSLGQEYSTLVECARIKSRSITCSFAVF